MASFLFGLMMLLLLNFSKALQNFEAVSECPSNANNWKIKSDKKDCKGSTPDYLCAAIENHVGKYGEICTKYGLTPVCKYIYLIILQYLKYYNTKPIVKISMVFKLDKMKFRSTSKRSKITQSYNETNKI